MLQWLKLLNFPVFMLSDMTVRKWEDSNYNHSDKGVKGGFYETMFHKQIVGEVNGMDACSSAYVF